MNVVKGTENSDLPVTGTIYGPFSSQPAQSQTVPSDAPVFDSITKTITLNDDGAGTVSFTSTKAITTPGYYVWRRDLGGDQHHDGGYVQLRRAC